MNIEPRDIVRLVYDHTAIGIVREVEGNVAAVTVGGPGQERAHWVPLAHLEPVPVEELSGMLLIFLA
jgi:hypothetical protein